MNHSPIAELTVVVLTFNAENSLPQVLAPLRDLANRILVVDSYSTDRSVEIATSAGCTVLQHPFENYAAQRNWAQAQTELAPDAWILHLDADEVLDEQLVKEIRRVLQAPRVDAYLLRRITYFLGQPIRYGHMNPNWHLRLYRAGKGRCEDRLYDQHFVSDGPTERLAGVMHDLQLIDIERWTTTHNRWSTAEATEIAHADLPRAGAQLHESLAGDPRMRKRWLKNRLYYQAPLLVRPFIFFFYNYFIKLGILDGRVGLIYHILHAFWFRFLVDAKLYERRLIANRRPPAK